MPPSVTVRVPATSANLGPGFDCLGLALDLWAEVTLTLSKHGERDPISTMAISAARRVYDRLGRIPPQIAARYDGEIPIARGLGASAVARVGGAIAANRLTGEKLDAEDILAVTAALEGHADNAAPAVFGGMQVAVADRGRILHTPVQLPPGISAVLYVPELRMPTRESRKLLPTSLPRADLVYNSSRTALLVAAMAAGRFDLLDAATQDKLHQPARSKLFPSMFAIFEAAKSAGAHCAYLSGGGSTVCALASGNLEGIADAMRQAAHDRETPGRSIVTRPTLKGAHVVEGR